MDKVITLGFFDGVHIGHRAVIAKAGALADELGAALQVVTFESRVKNTPLIMTPEARVCEIKRLFPRAEVELMRFDEALMNMSAEEFAQSVLVGRFGAVAAAVGHDCRFGAGAKGDASLLARFMRVEVVPEVELGGKPVSATAVRAALAEGEIGAANAMLGRKYAIEGTVAHGFARGRRLGAATVNQSFSPELARPRAGVYISTAEVAGAKRRSVTNIGACPTFGEGGEFRAETHLLGFTGSLYGQNIRVELEKFVRDERKFASAEELEAQIKRDAAAADEYFNLLKSEGGNESI